ncbi:peptidoglycan-binding domain-containing protein [Nocardioides solisilvae]|uniref:peptidoglycan-binding domain-containing protein n=1 Tax=Nocardioides solisilvae TaxID=1542435 RepID=UPI000D7405A6|nr:peptidoglycan-binding domain-containing protein [Nocardioides solisilvae]
MDRLATACPHCGGPEQVSPTCVTCGALLWFQTPVPDDAEDTADRVYPGLSNAPGQPGRAVGPGPAGHPVVPGSSATRSGSVGRLAPDHTVVRPGGVARQPDPTDVPGPGAARSAGGAGGRGEAAGPAGAGPSSGPAVAWLLGLALVVLLAVGLVAGGWVFLDREQEVAADGAPRSANQAPQAPAADPDAADPDAANPDAARAEGDEAEGDDADGSPGETGAVGCTGDYVLVTPAATDVPAGCAELAAVVAEAAGEAQDGAATAAYQGPFRSSRVACRLRDEIGGTDVHVRRLAEDAGPRLACACLIAPRKLPDLGPVGVEGAGIGRGVSVSDAQVLLHEAGLNPDRLVGGSYGDQTVQWVSELQRRSGLPVTGRVDRDTWKALLGGCG